MRVLVTDASVIEEARDLAGPDGAAALLRVVSGGDAALAPDSYASAAASAAEEFEADIVVMPHGLGAEDLVPRLATLLRCAAALESRAVRREADRWVVTRPIYGGAIEGTFQIASARLVLSIEAAAGADEVATGADESVPCPGSVVGSQAGSVEVIEVTAEPGVIVAGERHGEDAPLEKARRIIAGGRGIGGPDGFERLEELATAIGGAVAASRPPCDSGWVPATFQVGITGKRVAPDIYIAVGISGSVQHLAGMSRAKCIVAINSDAEAPMFRAAHYGIVGDWQEVIDEVLTKVG